MALAATLDNLEEARAQAAKLHEFVLARRTYELNFNRWLGALGIADLPEQKAPAIAAPEASL
jgi:hypothetical protein